MSDWNRQYQLTAMITLGCLAIVLGTLVWTLAINADILMRNQSSDKADIRAGFISTERVQDTEDDWDKVENGIHLRTGMAWDENLKYIEKNCLACHSSKLITQNRATRTGWDQMISWMQETQGLHDLGTDRPYVLDYLSKHYAPQKKGRRDNLDVNAIRWYVLELD